MSLSRPQEGRTPNPATRFYEWNGATGSLRYYDKQKKENVDCGTKLSFILLDQLSSISGWHDKSQSGIYANEVKDTTKDVLVVKAFKGGTLAEGFYREIKDRVNVAGGLFTANCYVGFKNGAKGPLALGALRFTGAALNAWIEFCKAHRADLYQKGIRITNYKEGKKGKVVFRVPVFELVDVPKELFSQAQVLDVELQTYLDGYLKRNTRDQVEAPPAQVAEAGGDERTYDEDFEPPPPDDDDRPVDDDSDDAGWS
jgi:hypothetical protein